MILYKRFRGRKPNVNAFLRLNGLIWVKKFML
jgi:Zn-dependent oligopeptidase